MIEVFSEDEGWVLINCPNSAFFAGQCPSGSSYWGGYDAGRVTSVIQELTRPFTDTEERFQEPNMAGLTSQKKAWALSNYLASQAKQSTLDLDSSLVGKVLLVQMNQGGTV